MGYGLGVDLGTSFTGVAIGRHGRTRVVSLSDDPISASSLVAVRPPGSLLIREIDDTVPVVLGGRPYPAVAVLAEALRSALASVTASEGEAPEQVVLTCPAVWGPSRRQQFGEVSRRAGLTSVTVVSEPEAAVTGLVDARRLAEDDIVVVYDIGGVTVDMTVVRVTESGMEILGLPEGADGAGGADFDDLILAYVDRRVGGALSELDLTDPVAVGVLTGVRAECVRAKEALSRTEKATVRVIGLAHVVGLAGEMEPITIARSDFEALIRTPLTSTLPGLRRVLDSSGLQASDLTAVVLVGGSSRIPLVSRMLSKSLGRPVLVDEHPQHCVALGAAAIADGTSTIAGGARRITPGAPPITDSIPTIAAATAIAAAAAKSAESRAGAKAAGGKSGKGKSAASKSANKATNKSTAPDPRRSEAAAATPSPIRSSTPPVSMFHSSQTPQASPGPFSDKMLGAGSPGAADDAATLSRRAGGHREPGIADWRRWFDPERYSVAQRRWRVAAVTAVTTLLIIGGSYALFPSGNNLGAAVNTQIVDSPIVPTTTTTPPETTLIEVPSPSASTKAAKPVAPSTTPAPARTTTPVQTSPPTREHSPFRPIGPGQSAPITGTGLLVGLAGRCLDVFDGLDDDGTAVQIFGCNGTPAQVWTAGADGTLRAQGKCLQTVDVGAGAPRLQIKNCDGRGDQQWMITYGVIVNPASRRCLDVLGTNPDDRTPVITADCRGGQGQNWSLRN